MFRVLLPRSVQKQLDGIPDAAAKRILAKVLGLGLNPHPAGSLKIKRCEGYRIRVGEYRVLYDVNAQEKLVVIRAVGHRKEIYR